MTICVKNVREKRAMIFVTSLVLVYIDYDYLRSDVLFFPKQRRNKSDIIPDENIKIYTCETCCA